MGPRLVGRGKVALQPKQQCPTSASMGPRLVGRGKSVRTSSLDQALLRFNGAASCGTRKGGQQDWYQVRGDIASMGPRLVGRGKAARGVAVSRGSGPLQWGRVLWDAESWSGPTTAGTHGPCFNGAASCGTRKEQGLEVGLLDFDPSMGPRLVGRGKGPFCNDS